MSSDSAVSPGVRGYHSARLPASGQTVRRRSTSWIAALLVCAAVRPAAILAEESAPGWGPMFGERSLYALHVPLLMFGPADPEPLAVGHTRWSLESGYANSFSRSWHPPVYHSFLGPTGTPFRRDEADRIHRDFPDETAWFVDADVLRTSLKASAGVGKSAFVSVELPYVSYSAFTADGFISSFHSAFGLSQSGRSDFPKGQFVVMTQPSFGPLQFHSGRPASGVGDVVLTFSLRPAPLSRGLSWGVDVAAKAPTGRTDDFRGSGSWDAGVLAFLARSGEKWRVDAEAGCVIPGASKTPVVIETSPFARTMVAVTRRLGRQTRIGASVTVEQSPFHGARLGPVSQIGTEFALGIDRDFARWTSRFLVTEHLSQGGDRADFGFMLRATTRL
jgi:hypothetical protein